MAFNVDEVDDDGEEHETFWVSDDPLDEDTLAQLMSENDEDAALIVQFEEAVTEAVQNDSDLATYFSSYQDARRRLTERVKFRGLWPVKKGSKGFGKKGAGKSGGKGRPWPNELPIQIAGSVERMATGRLNAAFDHPPLPVLPQVVQHPCQFPLP